MDDATRGYLESVVDEDLRCNLSKDILWIKDKIPIQSFRDLVLGYTIGMFNAISLTAIRQKSRQMPTAEDLELIDSILKRRLPEILEKINRELGV